jgi:hypothetical protein
VNKIARYSLSQGALIHRKRGTFHNVKTVHMLKITTTLTEDPKQVK